MKNYTFFVLLNEVINIFGSIVLPLYVMNETMLTNCLSLFNNKESVFLLCWGNEQPN